MIPPEPAVDHSIWRYYKDGGIGFSARHAEKLRTVPRTDRRAEKEILASAVGKVKREKTSEKAEVRCGKKRSDGDLAVDRARQKLLGMILKDSGDKNHPSIPIDEKSFKAQVEKTPAETLKKMAGFCSTIRAETKSAASSEQKEIFRSLDDELAKRGISLQLSGKVNNVYLSGANSNWSVNASAGTDSEPDKRSNADKSAPRNSRYNNFGQTLGRAAKNFILGH
jgi:hypothetical protein